MINNAELPPILRKAMGIIQSAGDENGWMSKAEYERTQAELRELGIAVLTTMEDEEGADENPATDDDGRTFLEVSIHPIVEQFADENGKPVVSGGWFNPSGSDFSDEFGDDLDGYPDAMFRKAWSVSSWVTELDDEDAFDCIDDEEFPDYATAIARAEELAAKYRVDIDYRY